jgi:hypothetical protein
MIIAVIVLGAGLILVSFGFFAAVATVGYATQLCQWDRDRFAVVAEAFSAAQALCMVPAHDDDYVLMDGGNIGLRQDHGIKHSAVFAPPPPVMLNHETLISQVMSNQEVNKQRKIVQRETANAIKAVLDWQEANPQPQPPTFFGIRLPTLTK